MLKAGERIRLDDTPKVRAALAAHPNLYPRIASDVPAGWDEPVAAALEQIAQLSAETGVTIWVDQVKEKFWGLRLYLYIDEVSVGPMEVVAKTPGHIRMQSSAVQGSVRERAQAIVRAAEAAVARMCMVCGAPVGDDPKGTLAANPRAARAAARCVPHKDT